MSSTLMINVTCLPNYFFFSDLNTAGIIPSTFLLGGMSSPHQAGREQ